MKKIKLFLILLALLAFAPTANAKWILHQGSGTKDDPYLVNCSFYSNNLSFTPPITCAAPTNLTCTMVTDSTATLSWTDNSGSSSWQVCLNGDEENLIDATENPFILTGLLPESVNTAKIRSNCTDDVSDWSEWSNLVTFTTIPSEYIFSGSGTEEDPYLISSSEDWCGLSENLNNHYDYAGKYFLQTEDFSVVSIMVGVETRFEGVYDGGGHMLTFYAGTPEMPQNKEYCAPFHAIGNATIKNLNIDGAIYTSAKRVGGLAGSVESDLLVINCRSTITFANYNFDGYTSQSGFISYVHHGMTTVEGCVFQGTLLGNGTRGGGGFVGYTETAYGARATINDCFFDPVVCEWPATLFAGSGTFARAGDESLLTFGNNYYTKTLDYSPTQQGTKVYKVTNNDPEHVSIVYGEVVTSYDNSQLSIVNNGVICYGMFYSLNNKTHQLLLENIPQGFAIKVSANGVELPISNSQCSFNVNGQDVTITTEYIGVGEPIYVINSADDWNLMAYMVQLGYVDYTSRPLILNADITVSTTAGTSMYPFRGIFEGNGHTITFDMGTYEMPSNEPYCAPFRHIGDATIQNLNIEGTVYTSAKFAGGLAGIVDGNLIVTNCRSAFTINSRLNGDGSHGGFVGQAHSGSVSFTGCVVGGQLLGSSTKNCGGFIGWTDAEVSLTFTDCLFVPASITWNSDGSQTFARAANTSPFTYPNSGYHNAFGGGQGTKFQSIRPEHPSMITIAGCGGETTTYPCSGLSTVNNGLFYDGVCYGAPNNTFLIQLQACEGYGIVEVTANGQPVEEEALGYPIPVANTDVLIDATMTLVGDPVLEINTTGDWNLFAIAVACGHAYQDETVDLKADISVDQMVGSDMDHTFKGTFEGNGHTITMNLNSDGDWCAPFAYTYGATIQHLATTGTINTSGRYAGGVVGRNGTAILTMTDVTSSIAINSTYTGDAYHGGLVGYAINATLEGCVFNGSLLGEGSSKCAGLMGWKTNTEDSHADFNDCFFAPTEVTVSATGSKTLVVDNGTVNIANCYYTESLGTAQGWQVFRIIPDEGVGIANSGSVAANYEASGLIRYGAGIQSSGDLYACNGEIVSLHLECTPTPGCITDSYIVDAGNLSGVIHDYTLVMPNQDVLVSLAPDSWDGEGTEESPYLIYTFNQWKILAYHINNHDYTYSGEYFKLMKDITVKETFSSGTPSAMVGVSEDHSFQGHFDGNGHTMTLNSTDTSGENYCAPFRIVKNATVKRLHVTGVIEKTQKKHAGGIVGQSFGNTHLVACRSSVNVISGTDGDGSHGGLVGDVRGGTINIFTCLFDGEFNGPETTNWGGFIGYLASDKDANFINCLFDPKTVNVKNDGNRTFVRSGDGCDISFIRTFYTQTCGNAQAEQYSDDYQSPLGVEWTFSSGKPLPKMELYTFAGEGTEASPYMVDEWFKLVVNVNMGETYRGKYLQMTKNWNYYYYDGYMLAGLNEEYSFQGTFDGNGHRFRYDNLENYDGDDYNGPFRTIKDATIKRTYFAGMLYKKTKKYGGVIGQAYGNNRILSCRSGIELESQVNGDGSHGGFLGIVRDGSTHFIDCLFDGKMEGYSTTKWGGFVGWVKDGGEARFTNCLFNPEVIFIYDRSESREFARYDDSDDVLLTNCYRKNYLNESQGVLVPGDWSDERLRDALGDAWEVVTDNNGQNPKVVPIMGLNTLEGSGTPESPYLIASTDDWNAMALHVRQGNSYAGKYVQLTGNITVSTMVGTDVQGVVYHFGGTFDGNGHTLNLNLNSDADWCAPFAYTYGATIQNLATTGTINTSGRYAGGVVGRSGTGNLTMTNVTSDVCINATYESDACHGGLVGWAINATFEGCSFTGSLLSESSTGCSGLLGWKTNTSGSIATFTDCLFAPNSISTGAANAYTFARNSSGGVLDFTNCYYTESLGTVQGKVPHSITAEEEITVTNAGTATEYDVSGITGYGTGILLDSTLYAAAGDQVSLNLERETELGFTSTYSVSAGTLSGTTNPYTLIMPDQDVVITAETIVDDWEGSGTEDDPYIIYTWQQLDLLSERVNGLHGQSTNTFEGKFFRIGNDIEYPHESEWDNLESDETNYTAIGTGLMTCFKGTLDGDGHTISGIRIYNNYLGMYQGLFGYLSGTIMNLTLADTRIVGRDYDGGCGAIVGYNDGGAVSNCHVTSTVAIHLIRESNSTSYCGGVVGYNRNSGSVVSHCSSAAKVTADSNLTRTHYIGGIVGMNYQGVIHDNLAIGATVTPADDHSYSMYGAIAAYNNNGTMELNYYGNCTVDGVLNATNVGCNSADIIANDGAVPCPTLTVSGYGDSDGSYVLIASPIGTVNPENVTNMLTNEYDLYRFNQAVEAEWENYKATENGQPLHPDFTTLEPGKGYLYANSEDVTLFFPGTPYNGTGVVTLAYTTENPSENMRGWNLVGNPFAVTAYIDRPFYVMNPNGTEIIAAADIEQNSIAPMEGIFVKATESNETLTFTTTAPESTGSKGLALNLSQGRGGVIDRTIVRFGEGHQLPKFQMRDNSTKLYITQDNVDYAVVNADAQSEMPLNFKAKENGQYTLTVTPENVEMSYLHLIDNLTGADVDLLAATSTSSVASYTFTAKTTDYASRFKLVFDCEDANDDNDSFAFYSNGSWNISNEGSATLQVIDVNGRILSSETVNGSVSKAIIVAPGVYMIRLINGNDVKTQKIVVK